MEGVGDALLPLRIAFQEERTKTKLNSPSSAKKHGTLENTLKKHKQQGDNATEEKGEEYTEKEYTKQFNGETSPGVSRKKKKKKKKTAEGEEKEKGKQKKAKHGSRIRRPTEGEAGSASSHSPAGSPLASQSPSLGRRKKKKKDKAKEKEGTGVADEKKKEKKNKRKKMGSKVTRSKRTTSMDEREREEKAVVTASPEKRERALSAVKANCNGPEASDKQGKESEDKAKPAVSSPSEACNPADDIILRHLWAPKQAEYTQMERAIASRFTSTGLHSSHSPCSFSHSYAAHIDKFISTLSRVQLKIKAKRQLKQLRLAAKKKGIYAGTMTHM